MDFSLIFDKIELELDSIEQYPLDTLYHSLFLYQDDFPSLENADIALFSVDDNRETGNNILDATEIRKALYSLKKSDSFMNVVDLGVLRPGPQYSDTQERLTEVLEHLFSNNIIPVIINSSQDVVVELYKSFANTSDKKVNISVIDDSLDLEGFGKRNDMFITDLLGHLPNSLHRFKLMGYQSYRVSQNITSVFQKLSFEELRLGALKRDVFSSEVLIRNSHIFSLDMGALKSIDFPANGKKSPFGLTSEETCQICWFAGHAADMKAISFANYYEEFDQNNLSANGLSVMIWYFIQGFYARVPENMEKDTVKYIVENDSFSENLFFVKGVKTNKWWLKIEEEYLPCVYNDYLKANEGVLPDVWLREVSR